MVGTIKLILITEKNCAPFDDLCMGCIKYNECDMPQNECKKIKALYEEIYYP